MAQAGVKEKVARSLPIAGAAGGDAALEADTRALHRALTDLVRVYQFRDRDRICCYDVSVTQCYALEAVVLQGPMTVNEIAAALRVDKSTTSRVVDALLKKGYVDRTEDPDDRRYVRIAPTEAGRTLHARIEADLLADEQALLADFPPEVRRSVTEAVRRLAANAAARLDGGPGCCAPG